MSTLMKQGSHSAEVNLALSINGSRFPLTHTAREFVILAQPAALPEGDAEIVVTIDGCARRRPVTITDRALVRQVVPISTSLRS